MTPAPQLANGVVEEWYGDWQNQEHAIAFDVRAGLDRRNLIRNFESFNDVRLLKERVDCRLPLTLLEVGCATGEFYRYVRATSPRVRYYGIDISHPAIARAKEKYPQASVFVTDPSALLAEALQSCGIPAHPDVVYSKDVVHHQTRPLEQLSQLIQAASQAVIIRTRTRDVGPTEWDPEQSCQFHYGGWMPFIVLNLQELIEHIMAEAPGAEVVVYRHRMVLGGRYNRFLSKELFLKETGTAETAVGVLKKTKHPGRVTVEDRVDANPSYTWDYLLKHAARQARDVLRIPTRPMNGYS